MNPVELVGGALKQRWWLYADVTIRGGLPQALGTALHAIGSPLVPEGLDELDGRLEYVSVKGHGRMSQVYMAANSRRFLCDFWSKGVMLAKTSSRSLRSIARTIAYWIDERPSTTELATSFPSVALEERARAFEDDTEVDEAWSNYDEIISEAEPALVPFFALAKRTPYASSSPS